MNTSERLIGSLDFRNMHGEGAVVETFFPWNRTLKRFVKDGLPKELEEGYSNINDSNPDKRYLRYFSDTHTEMVYKYEQYLGFEGVKRMSFRIPFKCFDKEILEENDEYTLVLCEDGWQKAYYKNRDLVKEVRPVISDLNDWREFKKKVEQEIEMYCTQEKLEKVYGKYSESHKRGDYSIRFRVSGFFWTARTLLGVEEQLIAFYDEAEMMHEINEFILKQYLYFLDKIFDLIQPEVILFEEDLSGANGPMISKEMFDEFIGSYYKKIIPFLKKKGVRNVFVDTDGDFRMLIPNFIKAGVDGFLPMDVNAGMDIVAVRKEFPNLKFIGAFNKLMIEAGKDAIDEEFERLLPVIRQGGYVPGSDHQVTPDTSLENYQYYIMRLKEVMKQAGAEAQSFQFKDIRK